MKYNPLSGTGIELRLFEKSFFSSHVRKIKNEYFFDGRKIAERKTLPLERKDPYNTQFYNEQLSKAFDQISEETLWEFRDSENNIIPNLSNLPTLKKEFSSFVYEIEPETIPTTVSVVLYEGPTEQDILLKDGSVEMNQDYYPSKDQDIITKRYIDDYLAIWAAEREEISTFTLTKADGRPLDMGYRFTDNELLPVLCVQKYYLGNAEKHTIHVDPFSIPPTWVNPKIAVMFGNMVYYASSINKIIDGTDTLWTLSSSKNLYTNNTPKTFWKNGYSITFNPTSHSEILSLDKTTSEDVTLEVKIKVWDDNNRTMYSDGKEIGIDYWMWKVESENSLSYIPEELAKYRTVWVSGVSYYPDTDDTYTVKINTNISNNFLAYYRPKIVARLFGVYENQKEPLLLKEISLDRHSPLFKKEVYNIPIEVQYTVGLVQLKLVTYNLQGTALNETFIDFNTETDSSDESNRVSTPEGTNQFPVKDYGKPWDSTAPLKYWDMKLRKGVYTYSGTDSSLSAVCFKVEPKDCFSHIQTDIEHNGTMYIKVQGMTGWLDCIEHKGALTKPTDDGEGCLVNNNFYSFGKVIYKEPVFIRIVGAKRVQFKSATLG